MIGRSFATEVKNKTLIVTPLRDLGGFAGDELREEYDQVIDEARADGIDHLLLDLSLAGYFGSNVLEFMVVLWKRVREKGGNVAFCNVSTVAGEILKTARFHTIWPIYTDREQALAELERGD